MDRKKDGLLLLLLYLAHPFNLIQVSFFSFISFIVSTNLKQQILSHLKIVKKGNIELMSIIKPKSIELMRMCISTGDELINLLNDSERRMTKNTLVIEEGCGNELEIYLKICGLDHLKKLIVKKNSLKNLNSLVISNNSELESIVTENGNGGYIDESKKTGVGYYVKSVEISSIF